MKLINYLKCAYTVIRPAGFSYCIALLIGALASYIGANSQSRITAMIQSVDSSAHILPLLGYSVIKHMVLNILKNLILRIFCCIFLKNKHF